MAIRKHRLAMLFTYLLGLIFVPAVYGVPTLTSISPTTLSPGMQATLTGSGFGATQGTSGSVQLQGSGSAPIVSWSDTQIVVTVPIGTIGGHAYVNQYGASSGYANYTMTPPVLTSISPTTLSPGMQATLTGSGFGATQGTYGSVQLQGSGSAPIVSWSDTQIVVTIPTGTISGHAYVNQYGASSGYANYTMTPPVLTSISPTTLSPGMQATLTGSGFGATQGTYGSVHLQGSGIAPIASWSDTQIVVTVPTGTIGGHAYVNQYGASSGYANYTMTPPVLTSISPTTLSPGMQATLTGSNFGATQGTYGSVHLQGSGIAPIVSWSDTQIVVTVPTGTIGGHAYVNQYGASSGYANYTMTPPVLTSISPTTLSPGMQATLTGSGFGATQGTYGSVQLQGSGIAPIVSWSDTQIVVTIPTGTISGHAYVNQYGASSGYANFTIVPPPSISSLSPSSGAVGTIVTISGSNFGTSPGSSTVSFNGIPSVPTSWSSSSIVVPVPSGATTGNVQVTVSGLATTAGVFTVTASAPNISSFSPAYGLVGTQVTITGTNFGSAQGTSTITFNGTTATSTSWSDTQIVVPVPPGATSGPIQVTVSGAGSATGGTFTISVPVLNLGLVDSPGEVNLSDPLNLDWIVWGGNPQTQQNGQTGVGVTRMSGSSLISDVTFLNSNNTSYDQYGLIRFDWNNGSPVSTATQSTPELNAGAGTVIQLTAPADTTVKTLKVYIGLWGPTKIDAALSDGSATSVTTTIGNDVSEEDELVSLDYRAASAGQTLTITVTALTPDGFFDLYAAALAPHVPAASITSPSPNQAGITGTVATTVNAQQSDFGITDVQLFADGANLFSFTQPPYSSTWSNISTGHHTLTATATDTNGLVGSSAPIEFDVIGTGGSLSATVQDAPASVDITQEGTADWRAWVSDNVSDPFSGNPLPVHKAGVVPQLSDATVIGNHVAYLDWNSTNLSFIDGVPTPAQTEGFGEGVFNGEIGTGLALTAPADATPRTLRLYVGVGSGDAKLVAFLSDGSAPVLIDTSVSSPDTETLKVYTINYQAASSNQTLTVRFTLANSYNYGNVSFFGATLQGPVQLTGPAVTAVLPDIARVGDTVTIYGTGFGQQQGANTAPLNNVALPVTSWSPYSINATVPAGSCGGQVSVSLNGTPTNSANLTVIAMPPDGTVMAINGTLQLNAITPCGTVLNGGYWKVANGTGSATISNPDPNDSSRSYALNPVLTGVYPGALTVTYVAADGTPVSSALSVMGIFSASVNSSQVTISGAGFGASQGTGYVVLNNLYGLVTSWSDSSIVATMQPGTISGNLHVHQGGADSNSVFFNSPWAPFVPAITNLSPTSGIFGDSITINGAHFGATQNGGSVSFNGVQARISSWSDNAITVQVPSGATTGNVMVTAYGSASNGSPFTVVTPVVSGVSPGSGQIGAAVTVTGTGFGQYAGSSFVSFNGTSATTTSWSDTSVVVTVPSGATTGNVVLYRSSAAVYRGNSSTTATSNGLPFTVILPTPIISSLSPSSGLPGKIITISGSNFGWDQSVATVTFNGVAATPTSLGPTAIVVPVPTGATSGNVVVTINGAPSTGVNFTVPTLSSIQLAPLNPSIAAGSSQRFTATGNYSDGSSQTVSNATWSSTASSIASVDSSGNAAALSPGQTTIQATVGSIAGSATLTVSSAVGTFAATGNLITGRAGHTATLLNNGQVLVVGGEDSNSRSLANAELYNPATGTFTATGNLNLARRGHSASLLNNGMVLIAGGMDSTNTPMASAELYDPSTGTFFVTGSLNTPRQYASATVLSDGRVLIVGGQSSLGVLASAEIYDPVSGAFSTTGSLATERVYHTATLLDDGTVLIVGGESNSSTALASAEIYNPATGVFTATSANLNDARQSHSATLLNNGSVLIAQGFDANANILSTAELYNPANGTFSYTASPNTARNGSTETLTGDGTVLFADGYNSSLTGLLAAESYDPVAAGFSTIGNIVTARKFHTATVLNNGSVLIAGGLDNGFNVLSAAELYQPATTALPSLVSIAITSNISSIAIGTAQRFIATGTFSDGSTQTLISVSWTSSSAGVATVTNDSSNAGAVYALSAGNATINACAGSICGNVSITVPASQLISVTINPANATLTKGASIPFFATGTYNNGSTQDLTAFVTWTSSAPSIASISGTGVATGLSTGLTSITATYGSVTANTNLSVAPPVSSISVTPKNLSLVIGATQQLTATATYTDGTSVDVTNTAQWTSQTSQVATVSAGGSLTAVGAGNTVLSASLNGVTGSTNLTVSLPTMTITSVSPQAGSAGTQVTLGGSGFGNTQGQGTAWLGTRPATIVSWSDTQIVVTVALGSSSGNAQVQQLGAASNSVPFTVIAAAITDFSPSAGPVGTQVTINGSGFGATQGSGQVYLGTVAGIVTSWSDTQVVATVAPGATSGPVEILQNGVFSNQFGFTVLGTPPQISGITPNSGPVGTAVSIRGNGFGAAEGNGYVSIGGTTASVLQWSDTLVVATVGNGAVSGVVKVQQNGAWSNGKAFTVTGFHVGSLPTMTISPTSVSMVVGDSRTLQALDSSGNTLAGLTWNSSDATVISLSTDDPPILTALQPGTVTITAGAASADITVYTGPTLPLGSTIWSSPGDGSGVNSIMPAVPSATGVADVFAINNSGNIQAVQSDGTVAWTKNVPVNDYPYFVPDFQGGLVVLDTSFQTLYRFDGLTGQTSPTYGTYDNLGFPVVHTDGTIFITDNTYDPNSGASTGSALAGIDPSTMLPKFKATAANSSSSVTINGQVCQIGQPLKVGDSSAPARIVDDPIIAGDGNAYVTYFAGHSDIQIQDAPQPYPLAVYPLFSQLGADLSKQSLNNNSSTSGAVLADVTSLAQLLGYPALNTTSPVDVWDNIGKYSQAGNVLKAGSYYNSVAQKYAPICNKTTSDRTELHVLKVASDGSASDSLIQQWQTNISLIYGRVQNNPWSYTQTQSGQAPAVPYRNLITNADQGAVLAWGATYAAYCAAGTELGCNSSVDQRQEYHLAQIPGGDVIMPEIVPNPDPAYYQWGLPLEPMLQSQDGTYVGTDVYGTHYLTQFDMGGGILNITNGAYSPKAVTEDGSIVATVPSGNSITLDSSLSTMEEGGFNTQSWSGDEYLVGSIDQISSSPIFIDGASFWPVSGGNPSGTGTAVLQCPCLLQTAASAGTAPFVQARTMTAQPTGAQTQTYLLLVGDPGLNLGNGHNHNVGNSFNLAAQTLAASLSQAADNTIITDRVSSVTDFNTALTTSGTINGGVYFFGHGGLDRHSLSALFPGQLAGNDAYNITALDVKQLSNKNLATGISITLNACHAGFGGDNSIAQLMANQLKRVVYAPTVDMFFSTNPNPHFYNPKSPADANPTGVPTYMVPNSTSPLKRFRPKS